MLDILYLFQVPVEHALLLTRDPESPPCRALIPADARFKMSSPAVPSRELWLGFVSYATMPDPSYDRNFAAFWMSRVNDNWRQRQRNGE